MSVHQTTFQNQMICATTQYPFTSCPHCNMASISFIDQAYRTCVNNHFYYSCPTCGDTRVSATEKDVVHCGLFHPYTVVKHDDATLSTVALQNRNKAASNQSLRNLSHWEKPFH